MSEKSEKNEKTEVGNENYYRRQKWHVLISDIPKIRKPKNKQEKNITNGKRRSRSERPLIAISSFIPSCLCTLLPTTAQHCCSCSPCKGSYFVALLFFLFLCVSLTPYLPLPLYIRTYVFYRYLSPSPSISLSQYVSLPLSAFLSLFLSPSPLDLFMSLADI